MTYTLNLMHMRIIKTSLPLNLFYPDVLVWIRLCIMKIMCWAFDSYVQSQISIWTKNPNMHLYIFGHYLDVYPRFCCTTGQNWFGPLLLEFTMVGKGHQALLHSTLDHWYLQTWTCSLPQPPASQQHDGCGNTSGNPKCLVFLFFPFFLM